MTKELKRFEKWWDAEDDIPNNGPYTPDTPIQFAWAGWQAALAQPEQEPIGEAQQMSELVEGFTHCIWDARVVPVGTKLYAAPPQSTEQPAQQEPVDHKKLAALGWQSIECPFCGSSGAQAFPKPEQEPVEVPQFRAKGCSDWYDGHPDYSDGGGAYETRILYTTPPRRKPLTDEQPVSNTDELAQPEQEPMLWVNPNLDYVSTDKKVAEKHGLYIPLYTTPPPQRPWVGLIRGVRVEGDTVVITVKGGNDAARELCSELLNEMGVRNGD